MTTLIRKKACRGLMYLFILADDEASEDLGQRDTPTSTRGNAPSGNTARRSGTSAGVATKRVMGCDKSNS